MPDPSPRSVGRVAVVGAGVAGLACARALAEHEVDVVVFDKGRAPGGRLATRRIPPFAFDLGAQYFTVRGPRLAGLVRSWCERGACAPWRGLLAAVSAPGATPSTVEPIDRFVGTPGMSALASQLATGLVVRTTTRVDRIERRGGALHLVGTSGPAGVTLTPSSVADDRELGVFDAVVVAIPPAQASALVAEVSASLAAVGTGVAMEPCLALGVAVAETDELARVPFDGLFVGRAGEHPLTWIARDSSKPGRPPGEAWVVHASASWSASRVRDSDEDVTRALLGELAKVVGVRDVRPIVTTLQRWAYARPRVEIDVRALFDDGARLAVGGDWAAGGRIEGALESGWALAARVLGR